MKFVIFVFQKLELEEEKKLHMHNETFTYIVLKYYVRTSLIFNRKIF